MNATMRKFGFPATLLHETEHWCVLLRPQQVTFCALVLAAKSEASALHLLAGAAFTDMACASSAIASALHRVRRHDKINYLALMMVDPHVHFHVLPRYASDIEYNGVVFRDAGWPGVPDLKSVAFVDETTRSQLMADMLDAFKMAR